MAGTGRPFSPERRRWVLHGCRPGVADTVAVRGTRIKMQGKGTAGMRMRHILKTACRPLLTFGVVLGLTAGVWGRDIYVNQDLGDDRYQGHSPDSQGASDGPCRTIARALFLARAGDQVILAPTVEPYRESVTLQGPRHSGLVTRPFRIVGNGAVLDGRQTVRPAVWQPVGRDLYSFQPALQSLGMLYRDERPAYPRARPVVETTPDTLGEGEGCLFEGWYYFRAAPNRMPVEYTLSATLLPVGLTLCDVHNVEVLDLVVQGYRQDGVAVADGTRDAHLCGLTTRGNGRAGISVSGAARVEIDGCLSGNNGMAQIWLDGESTVRLQNNTLPTGSARAMVRMGGRLLE